MKPRERHTVVAYWPVAEPLPKGWRHAKTWRLSHHSRYSILIERIPRKTGAGGTSQHRTRGRGSGKRKMQSSAQAGARKGAGTARLK